MVEGLRRHMGAALDRVDLRVNAYDDAAPNGRPLVLWMHHDINQQSVQWLQDAGRTSCVDRFVFVSNWQRDRYIARFGLPADRCVVLRNATEVAASNRRWFAGRPLKMAYTSTPYRGLSILLDAWDLLRPSDAELHIWSSHKLYGPAADDTAYEPLYARAQSLPQVHYHGVVPRAELCETLRGFNFLTYPNIFEETSCMAAIDAMAAGCRVICPALGALPETVGAFGRIYPFTEDPQEHARRFAEVLADEIRNPWSGDPFLSGRQQDAVRRTYDWSVRKAEWQTFIDALLEGEPHPSAARLPGETQASRWNT